MKKPEPVTTASSNWKKLLPNIQKGDTSKKRKAQAAPESKRTTHTKRVKTTTITQEQAQKIPKKEDLWFGEDIDDEAFRKVYGKEPATEQEKQRKKELVKEMDAVQGDKAKMGKYVAIDCEMVGVGPGGRRSALARVSIVNYFGAVLLDTFVKPEEKVTDYRTFVSGVTAKHLVNAMPYQEARQKVMDLIQDRVLVGHAVLNDLRALDIHHPKLMIRDTSRYKPFRDLVNGKTPALKRLVNDLLEIEIQEGKHSSVEDARFTMLLYRKVKDQWEKHLGSKYGLKLKKIATRIEKTEARRERREKQLENEKKKEQRKQQK